VLEARVASKESGPARSASKRIDGECRQDDALEAPPPM
jgi:hypothetical protein